MVDPVVDVVADEQYAGALLDVAIIGNIEDQALDQALLDEAMEHVDRRIEIEDRTCGGESNR
jgi:hypothetical protein